MIAAGLALFTFTTPSEAHRISNHTASSQIELTIRVGSGHARQCQEAYMVPAAEESSDDGSTGALGKGEVLTGTDAATDDAQGGSDPATEQQNTETDSGQNVVKDRTEGSDQEAAYDDSDAEGASASFRHVAPIQKTGSAMNKTIRYKLDLNNLPPLTDEQKAGLKALSEIPDDQIDYSDIPPLDDAFWKNAVRNPFYKPTKTSTTVRVDSDVMAWLKSQGRGYQTRMNAILRDAMLRAVEKRPTSGQNDVRA